jgi:hypothetical protein
VIWWVLAIAFCVSAWALLIAISARLDTVRLERTIAEMLNALTTEDAARTAALIERTHELEAARARLEQLRHKYETTLKLYQDSVAIDGPLGSKRIQ